MDASDDVAPLLKNIGPAGWPGAVGMTLFGIPIWAYQACVLAVQYLLG